MYSEEMYVLLLIISDVSCEFVFKAVHAYYIISIHSDFVVYACWIEVYCCQTLIKCLKEDNALNNTAISLYLLYFTNGKNSNTFTLLTLVNKH